jgi:hypothetical protein
VDRTIGSSTTKGPPLPCSPLVGKVKQAVGAVTARLCWRTSPG